MLEWIQLLTAVIFAGVLIGTGISTALTYLCLKTLQKMIPHVRFKLVTALISLPFFSGVLALIVVSAPSLLDAHGIIGDHCGEHNHHAFHICFLHGSPPPLSALVFGGTLVMLIPLVVNWASEIRTAMRAARWAKQLSKWSHFDEKSMIWIAETDQALALTVGLFRPQIFISSHVQRVTTEAQLGVVIAHEKAHVRRHDSLAKILIRGMSILLAKGPRTILLEELDVASEQACDEYAAEVLGDRLLVAETLLKMRKILAPIPAATMGFGATALERRVRGMLDGHVRPPQRSSLIAVAISGFTAIVFLYDELHHAIEALLSTLF